MRIRNTEVMAAVAKTFTVVNFCPGKSGLSLLDVEGLRFTRYKIHSVSIAYKSESSTTVAGVVTFGISAGPANDEIKDKNAIMKLRPFRSMPVWRSDGFTVGSEVQSQTWLYCNGDDRDSSAFTLYYQCVPEGVGYFQFTYDITLAYPNP